jgi:hypothetical protein
VVDEDDLLFVLAETKEMWQLLIGVLDTIEI